jgi:hypothetical protein
MTINEQILDLQNQVNNLKATIKALSDNTENKFTKPITITGGTSKQGLAKSVDTRTGRGLISGGGVVFNNTEIDAPYGTQPTTPTIGYNKHAHSRFSGGALVKDVLEIVEFDWGIITNKHSQGFLKPEDQPPIATEINSNGETVEKIGLLDLVFNPDTETWGVASYEIDVKKCYLVQRDENGDIELDENGNQMKSPLYNTNQTKTSVVWDKNAQVFRFLSVYASGEEV